MRDPHRMRDSFEVQLDNKKVVGFVVVSLAVLGVVFALGVMVGKQLASGARPPPAQDPLALIDAKEKGRAGGDSVTGTGELPPQKPDHLTFATELTRTPKPGSSPVEPTRTPSPPERRPDVRPPPAAAERADAAGEWVAPKGPEKVVEAQASRDAAPAGAARKGEEKAPEKVEKKPVAVAARAEDPARRKEGLAAAFDKAATRSTDEGQYCLQVSSVPSREEADKLASRLASKGVSAYVAEADVAGKGRVFRVRVGSFSTRDEADAALKAFGKKSTLHAIVTAAH